MRLLALLGLNQTESLVLTGRPSAVGVLEAVQKATNRYAESTTEVSAGCVWLRRSQVRYGNQPRLPWLTILTVHDLGGETVLRIDSRVSPFVIASPLLGFPPFLLGYSPLVATLCGVAAAAYGWALTRWMHLTVRQLVLRAAGEVSRGEMQDGA